MPLTAPGCCTCAPCRGTHLRSRQASGARGSQQPWRTRSGEPHFQPAVRAVCATCTLLHPLATPLCRQPRCRAACRKHPHALLLPLDLPCPLPGTCWRRWCRSWRRWSSAATSRARRSRRWCRSGRCGLHSMHVMRCDGLLCFMLGWLWHCTRPATAGPPMSRTPAGL